jgi:hypothetical protein
MMEQKLLMRLHEYTNKFHTRCSVHFPRRSHIILTQIYPFSEEYWEANSITCIVAIMVDTVIKISGEMVGELVMTLNTLV